MTTPPSSESSEDRREPELPTWARRPNGGGPELADHRLALFIGRKWETTYRRKFAPFLEDPSFTPTWNWSAFFAAPIWFLYRKLYLPFVLFMFVPPFIVQLVLAPADAIMRPSADMTPEQTVEAMKAMVPYFAFELSSRIAAAGIANWLLFRRARAAARFVDLQPWSEQESQQMLARLGGVHKGPTILLSVLFGTAMLAQVLGQMPA